MTIRSKQRLNIFKPFNIVLVEPEIPPNTGNIARLCAATHTKLHLVHPLGFEINDKHLKRAGLDYWDLLDIKEYKNWEDFCLKHSVKRHCEEHSDEAISKTLGDYRARLAPAERVSANAPLGNDNEVKFWFISTRGEKNIWDIEFCSSDYLIFGSETKGLSENIIENPKNKDSVISIPMNGKTRSLNLSTAVGIVLYEGLRQLTVEKRIIEVIPI